jgi:hypothetical protein
MKKVLLDENLPRPLKTHFSDQIFVTSVPDMGWQSKENGELLAAMKTEGFEYLLTADRNLRFQQNLSLYNITVVVVVAYDTRLKALLPHVGTIESAILEHLNEPFVEVDIRPAK